MLKCCFTMVYRNSTFNFSFGNNKCGYYRQTLAYVCSSAKKMRNYYSDYVEPTDDGIEESAKFSKRQMHKLGEYFDRKNDKNVKPTYYMMKLHFQDVYSRFERNDFENISMHALTYLPKTAHSINRERDFVDGLLTLWWSQIKYKLISRQLFPSNLIKGALFGLCKIDVAINGSLRESFEWKELEFMIDYVLDLILDVSPQNANIFFKCVISLVKNYCLNEAQRVDLKQKFANALDRYVNGILDKSVHHWQEANFDLCQIVFKLNLNFDFTSDELSEDFLIKLVSIYMQILAEHRFRSSFDYLKQLHFMAEPFLAWNFDPTQFVRNFWTLWYDRVHEFYRTFESGNVGLFHALVLMDSVKISLKFDQETEFLKRLAFWREGVYSNRRFIKDKTCSSLESEIKDKYLKETYDGIVDEITVLNMLSCLK